MVHHSFNRPIPPVWVGHAVDDTHTRTVVRRASKTHEQRTGEWYDCPVSGSPCVRGVFFTFLRYGRARVRFAVRGGTKVRSAAKRYGKSAAHRAPLRRSRSGGRARSEPYTGGPRGRREPYTGERTYAHGRTHVNVEHVVLSVSNRPYHSIYFDCTTLRALPSSSSSSSP